MTALAATAMMAQTAAAAPSRRRSSAAASNETIHYVAPDSLASDEPVCSNVLHASTEDCAICLDALNNRGTSGRAVALHVCGHQFHANCIKGALAHGRPQCPTCRKAVGKPQGTMPSGTMTITRSSMSCGGYESVGSIQISYNIPSGRQMAYHPSPGQRHGSAHRVGYLPDNAEGQALLKRLKFAFQHGLTFTIGTSLTSGVANSVTWSSIHHKTSPHGGAHGFPDPSYFANCDGECDAANVPAADDL